MEYFILDESGWFEELNELVMNLHINNHCEHSLPTGGGCEFRQGSVVSNQTRCAFTENDDYNISS